MQPAAIYKILLLNWWVEAGRVFLCCFNHCPNLFLPILISIQIIRAKDYGKDSKGKSCASSGNSSHNAGSDLLVESGCQKIWWNFQHNPLHKELETFYSLHSPCRNVVVQAVTQKAQAGVLAYAMVLRSRFSSWYLLTYHFYSPTIQLHNISTKLRKNTRRTIK